MFKAEEKEVVVEQKSNGNKVKGKVVGCKYLNIRQKRNADSKILKIVPAGTELSVFNPVVESKFYEVRTAGVHGYVVANFIKLLEE